MAASFPCPHCGADVPPRAPSCRECGSDAATGWSDEAESAGVDLPEEMTDADYAAFLARELPQAGAGSAGGQPGGGARLLRSLAVSLLLLLLALAAALF